LERRRLAERWIVVVGVTIFVDAMRMLYVCALTEKYRDNPNERRFPEFVEMGAQHLTDFDNQMLRFLQYLENDFIEKIRAIETGLRWLFNRLKRGPHLSIQATVFTAAFQIARDLDSVCCASQVEDYDAASRMVDQIATKLDVELGFDISGVHLNLGEVFADAWEFRLAVQTRFLHEAQGRDEMRIFTIADDRNYRFALPYFLVDLWLLKRCYMSPRA
jgi:hypothetical protein